MTLELFIIETRKLRIVATFIMVGALAMPTSAMADGSSGRITISGIQQIGDRTIISAQNINNPDNCGSNSAITIPANANSHDKLFSLALTAMASGKPVSMWLSGCAGTDWGYTVPAAYIVQIEQP